MRCVRLDVQEARLLACVDELWHVAQAMQQMGQVLKDLQVDMQEIGEPVYTLELLLAY